MTSPYACPFCDEMAVLVGFTSDHPYYQCTKCGTRVEMYRFMSRPIENRLLEQIVELLDQILGLQNKVLELEKRVLELEALVNEQHEA